MAHNSKRNRRHTTAQDGDDYEYPTAKIRETKTRNRKRDSDAIEAGLVAYENQDPDFDAEDWYDDEPMPTPTNEDQQLLDEYNEMIEEFNSPPDDYTEHDFDGSWDHDPHAFSTNEG